VCLESFAVRAGSGGAGARRGGDGAVRRLKFLEPMQVSLLSSHRLYPPHGVAGGGDGAPGAQRLIRADGTVQELDGCFSLYVSQGDAIEIMTPGGGGFGPLTETSDT
jgi:5-oxoprolinase (ATP-hydrolysing)